MVFVERDRRAVTLIRQNLARIRPPGRFELIDADLVLGVASLRQAGESFAIAFLDPPYDAPDLPALLESAALLVAPAGILVLEHRSSIPVPASPLPGGLRRFRDYRHGDTTLTTFRRDSETA